MFQYIKRNILRRGDSPNNDFGFLADQLAYHVLQLCISLSILVLTHPGILKGSPYIHILLAYDYNDMMQLLCNTPKKFKTSCPYYNVKLSLVFLKLPLLPYSDHKVTFFTNPKLTNIQ